MAFLAITSCKSKKTIVEYDRAEDISTKEIINNHYDHNFNQKTINARLFAKYSNQRSSASIIIKLRMEKDKTIWMSATKLGVPFAKVKITPTRVSYYEKLQKTYFDGDFALLSKWLGTSLDFEKVQNMLLGQAIMDLNKGKYTSRTYNNTYQITPKNGQELLGMFFFLNPKNFKMNKQEIGHPKKKQLLSVSYKNYLDIKGEQIPKNIYIKAIDERKLTTINIEYRSIEFNKKLTFPFTIPNGYKEINLE